jgi:hypothetical protein
MFSTSMMASSTTTPTEITRPARIIVLIVVARRYSTNPAASSDSGMATALMTAARQSYRNRTRIRITSSEPSSSARLRLPMAASTKVAGRKMVESISMPGRPGRISWSATSTPRVTSRVLPQGSFSTISIRPGRR